MANIRKGTNKDGKPVYYIRVSAGLGADGRYIYRSDTFTPPPGLTARQREKAARQYAEEFEQRVKDGGFAARNMTVDGLAEKWMKEYCETQLKAHTIQEYKKLLPRVSVAIGYIKLSDLKPGHIQQFYSQLAQPGIREDGKYKARKAFIDAFPKGTRKELRQKAGIAERTLTEAMAGRNISKRSAEKIAAAAGWAFTKAFISTSADKLSTNGQRHYHAMLSSMFGTAVKWQLMDANPCARVIPPKLVQPDIEFLDEKQIAALLAALHDAPKQLSVIVQIALFTGARRGEICGLRWSDLNFDTELMTINRNLSYIAHKGMIFDYPKTKKSLRCFTMSGDCIELLKDYKRFQAQERLKVGTYWKQKIVIEGGKRVKNDLLFTRADGSPIDPSSVSAWFPEFLREHNLPPCRFHSLRHSNAALMIAAHVPVTTVAGRLGHAQVSTTTNIYAGFIRSSDAAAADALGSVFEKIKKHQEIG